ncbi:DNA repair protein RadC [Ameyamaea chiangmaiensis NBRC 103196]|nr:DNA repair protein RadC [Ameyamaea chiangmaiensis NBRC 103196]
MRDRVLGAGPASLADYEILEMLLFFGIARRDTKPLAKALINRFGSLSAVLLAPGPALMDEGVPEGAIRPLRLPVFAARRLAGPEPRDRLALGDWDRLMAYFDAQAGALVPGQLRMLFLDNRNRLLADEAFEAEAGVRAVLVRGLSLHATALIGVRIAAGGQVLATIADRDGPLARELADKGGSLSIVLHDMMVIGPGQWLSFRQHGLL